MGSKRDREREKAGIKSEQKQLNNKTSFKYYTIHVYCNKHSLSLQHTQMTIATSNCLCSLFTRPLGDRTFKWDNCQIVYNFQLTDNRAMKIREQVESNFQMGEKTQKVRERESD